tara:strand:- start:35 stop:241 length:207 start_codon:yes stop_codon:yes gene_type:complete
VHKNLQDKTGRRKTKVKPLPEVEEETSETSGLEGIAESRNSGGIPGLLNILTKIENEKIVRKWRVHKR